MGAVICECKNKLKCFFFVHFVSAVCGLDLTEVSCFFPKQHLAIQCRSSQRAGVLGDIIQVYSGSRGRTIVFCETKKEANELAMNASLKQVLGLSREQWLE